MASNRAVLVLSWIFFFVFCYQGYLSYDRFQTKIFAQDLVTESISSWERSYEQHSGTEAKWKSTFTSIEQATDVRRIINHIGLPSVGLLGDVDKTFLVKFEPELFENSKIGLVKVCLGTEGAPGSAFQVRAPNHFTLLTGIQSLVQRLDISVDEVRIEGDGKNPSANLVGFCALMRK